MSNTLRLNMPLLDAAQAQKHVTINEAIVRADVLAARRVESRSMSAPPASPADGMAYIVGSTATGDWSGQENAIALFLNGGWDFVVPWAGAEFWIDDEHTNAVFVGGVWLAAVVSVSAGSATTSASVIEFDHDLDSGTVSTTAAIIPDKAVVLGVTGRVTNAIQGPLTWTLGVPESANRYGSGIGVAAGSLAHGVTGQPQAYFGATPLQITSDGTAFSGGTVRLAVHLLTLAPPHPV